MQKTTRVPRIQTSVPLVSTGVLAQTISILTLSPMPVLEIGESDKLHHFLAFFALALPTAVLAQQILSKMFPAILIFGAAIALSQPYVNRTGDWGDFWADTAGAIAGAGIGLAVFWLWRRLKNNNPNRKLRFQIAKK